MKRKFIQCSSLVNRNAVKRETIDGVEHIIVSSFTLPGNIVMNGIMYPSEEIDASFESLNRTLAPVEHPVNSQGQYVSASDPEAIHTFHAGAFNDNATKVGNRIQVDKVINVQEALKTERGKRLLDRINELETSDDPRPIHTSTGIFLELEVLDDIRTNAAGQEYKSIARNMVMDHDAILLDNVGAAQPHQGVGMAVNSSGEQIDVENIDVTVKCDQGLEDDEKEERIKAVIDRIEFNQEGLSHRNLVEQLETQVQGTVSAEWMFIADVFNDVFIIETDQGFFEVPYRVDNEIARVTGMPIRVDRVVSYQPKTNAKKDDVMKDMIINALKAVNKYEEGMSDEDALKAYNEMMTANNTDKIGGGSANVEGEGEGDAVATAVANALKPLQDQVQSLQDQLTANADAEQGEMVKTIVNSKRYPELSEDVLKTMPADAIKAMAANCGSGHGLPLNVNFEQSASVKTEMPE